MSHKTQPVRIYDNCFGGTRVLPRIDQGMVEIVRLLNRPGLLTEACCQGDVYDDHRYQNNPYILIPNAYVSVSGPAAVPFVLALLEDYLEQPDAFEPRIDRLTSDSAICIRWHALWKAYVTQRCERVLADLEAKGQILPYRS